jgi:hypothetical protein
LAIRTAPKKSGAAGQLARPACDVRVPESMESLIFEDNGGAGRGPSYSCPGCRHVLRVSGLGRHWLYFDRPNTLVMNGVCPVCRQGLPGKNGL